MSYAIDEIEGIGPANSEKLAAAGIKTTDQLLEACGASTGRVALSEATGIRKSQLLKWTNMADLMRISGVGKQFAELLEASGVDSVKELKHRRPDNLAAKLLEVNKAKNLAKSTPSKNQVERWVATAHELSAVISH